MYSTTLAQRRNRLTTHFSERILVVKRRMTVPRAVELLRYMVSVIDMLDTHLTGRAWRNISNKYVHKRTAKSFGKYNSHVDMSPGVTVSYRRPQLNQYTQFLRILQRTETFS